MSHLAQREKAMEDRRPLTKSVLFSNSQIAAAEPFPLLALRSGTHWPTMSFQHHPSTHSDITSKPILCRSFSC